MAQALIGLGSNLGDRRSYLQAALDALANCGDIRLLAASSFHETKPVGGPAGQDAFLNAAATLETSLPPKALLERLQEIESRLGRTRGERWSSRTMDLDLLLYDERVLQTPRLTLPHPRMAFRRFVLEPAVEIAPEMRHPVIGWTIRQLWEHLNTAPARVAIAGSDQATRSELAERIARRLPNAGQVAVDCWSELPRNEKTKLILWLDAPQDAQPLPAPWLSLESRDLDAATNEAVAAIGAMQ